MIMKQRFFVDWQDQAFPVIIPIEQATSEYATPLTIAEARQEIIDHFQADVQHARGQILKARQTTAADVMFEAGRS